MNDPKMVLDTLEQILYASAKAENLSERAAIYAAARWLLADFEIECQKKGLQGRSWEGILRLRESFGGVLGTEPTNPNSNLTYGAMGIKALKDLLPQLNQ